MKKKLLALLCAVCIGIPGLSMAVETTAAEPSGTLWFKGQLSGDETLFYQAMAKMYSQDLFKTGTGSIDMGAEGLTQNKLEKYAQGDKGLAESFQRARDAFAQDYEDLFYVDFSKLTFRLGQKGGRYVAYLGNGANKDYYQEGYTSKESIESAQAEAQAAKDEIKAEITESMGAASIVEAVHHALVTRFTYTYPSDGGKKVANIHGALQSGQANCEGYSRTLKWILDDYDIPTVLVSGTGVNSQGNSESHMWNYVRIKDQWYAVDVTWDDPMGRDENAEVKTQYLLVGSGSLLPNHYPLGIFSYGGKEEFGYPTLNQLDYKIYQDGQSYPQEEITYDKSGKLEVTAKAAADSDGDGETAYIFNYDGMTLKEAKEAGVYIAARLTYNKSDISWESSQDFVEMQEGQEEVAGPWFDLNPFAITEVDNPRGSVLPISKKCYVQFCATTIESPEELLGEYDIDLSEYENLGVTRKMLTPAYNNYIAPPTVRKATPSLGARMLAGQKQHMVIDYDERIVQKDSNVPIGMDVSYTESNVSDFRLENLQVSDYNYTIGSTQRTGTRFEFDFTPSNKYQSYLNVYTLTPTNAVSTKGNEGQQKAPRSFPICTTFEMRVPCPSLVIPGSMPDAFVLGYPALIVNEEMDIFETYEEPPKPANAMDIRLIATKKTQEESLDLTNGIEGIGQIKSAATYELSLGCNGALARLKSGANYHVTVGLPYPDGFNYEQNDTVEFKAYHYRKNADGSYTPEELVCKITPQGLVVMVDGFSPFSVVAVDKDPNAPVRQEKLMTVSKETSGGKILLENNGSQVAAAGLYKLEEGEDSKTFSVEAQEGYVIEKVVVDGENVVLNKGTKSYIQVFERDKMKADSSLKVYFVAQSVQQEEAEDEIQPVLPGESNDPQPDQPQYKEGTLSSPDGAVILSGRFKEGTQIVVSEQVETAAKDALMKYYKDGQVVKVMDISLSPEVDAFEGKLGITFQVGSKYEGKKLSVLHYTGGKVVAEGESLPVKDGKIVVEVAALSPFAIVSKPEGGAFTPPSDQKQEPEKNKLTAKQVKTGDTAQVLLYVVGIGAAVIVIISALIYRRKRR